METSQIEKWDILGDFQPLCVSEKLVINEVQIRYIIGRHVCTYVKLFLLTGSLKKSAPAKWKTLS